jgi:hypothetical protein
MWPQDFIDWARRLYPHAYQIAFQALLRRNNDPFYQADVPDLARQARQAAFELARQHLPTSDCFTDFPAFRFWIMAVVSQYTIRLYLLHPATQQRLNGLPLWNGAS